MKTSQVIETLKILNNNANCDHCLYGYGSKDECEEKICPVHKALDVAVIIVSALFEIRKGLHRQARMFKVIEDHNKEKNLGGRNDE